MRSDRPIRVLYMEDSPTQAELVRRGLARFGFEVDIAENGEKGLAMLEAGDYAAALVDQNMPGLEGLEVIRRLGERKDAPPAVMITGAGDEEIAVQAMKFGAADYIIKNSRHLELMPAVIEHALEKHRLKEEKRRAEEERDRLIAELQKALAEVKTLSGLLPICSGCKKIRNDAGAWEHLEEYIKERSAADFSHSLCPECAGELYPEIYKKK